MRGREPIPPSVPMPERMPGPSPHVDVKRVIAERLSVMGVRHEECVWLAAEVIDALRVHNVHLVSTPKFNTDPPKDSAEYEALMDPLALRYGTPDLRLKLGVTVDQEWIEIQHTVTASTLRYYRGDTSLQAIIRRKLGYELLHAMWKKLDPEGVVEL